MGMMHEGYFVGRKELTAWVQQNFQPNFAKVEDCASGVVYCQIMDSIFPGVVPMGKVKMQAKTEVESIHNFKILQTTFSKKRVDRYIDVDKLSKRSFQTNMEFLQLPWRRRQPSQKCIMKLHNHLEVNRIHYLTCDGKIAHISHDHNFSHLQSC